VILSDWRDFWQETDADIADKNYLLVTAQHFQQAENGGLQTAAQGGATGGALSGEKGGQTMVPHMNAATRIAPQTSLRAMRLRLIYAEYPTLS